MSDETEVKKNAPYRELNEGEIDANAWNEKWPEGSEVKVKYGMKNYIGNTTSSAAGYLGSAIISVSCFSFPIPLSDVTGTKAAPKPKPKVEEPPPEDPPVDDEKPETPTQEELDAEIAKFEKPKKRGRPKGSKNKKPDENPKG